MGRSPGSKDAAQAVYHAVVVGELAKMAIPDPTIDPNAHPHRSIVEDKRFMLLSIGRVPIDGQRE